MTQHYIGTKQITAWPESKDGADGYAVKYADGYTSWSPKDVFEKAYLAMGDNNDGTTVTLEMVEAFISAKTAQKVGEKTTVVQLTLCNGFEIVESSSCVDPANYDHELGMDIATKRAVDRVWMLLGFLLQCARNGI